MDLTLSTSHNIFLSREQRYNLFNGKEIEVVGVSVPIWSYKNKTSEPGNEVFCKYKLIPCDHNVFIKHTETGYDIHLPKEKHNPEDNNDNPFTLKNIIDHKDGGIEWIAFRQVGKANKNSKPVDIINFVEIKPIEDF